MLNEIVNALKNNKWGVTALLAGAAALVGSGVVDHASTEGQAAAAGGAGVVVLGVVLLVKKILASRSGGPPAAGGPAT